MEVPKTSKSNPKVRRYNILMCFLPCLLPFNSISLQTKQRFVSFLFYCFRNLLPRVFPFLAIRLFLLLLCCIQLFCLCITYHVIICYTPAALAGSLKPRYQYDETAVDKSISHARVMHIKGCAPVINTSRVIIRDIFCYKERGSAEIGL